MWTLDADTDVPVWRPASADPAYEAAFSTRRGGVSSPPFDSLNLGRSTSDEATHVTRNRGRFLASLNLDPAQLVTAGQVHGAVVLEARAPGHMNGCDALLTRTPDLVLAVAAADCLPLLYSTPGAVAAAHSGWRGTLAGLPRITLEALTAACGAAAADVRVHLGPCIRGCCYEVGRDVAARFPGEAVSLIAGRVHLDIVTAARLQLLEAGVAASALSDTGACTSCDPGWYFSYRRDAGRTGRHWGVVAMRSPGPRAGTGGSGRSAV